MIKTDRQRLQGVALFFVALSLTACGVGPDDGMGTKATTRVAPEVRQTGASPLRAEESLLLADHRCGAAPDDLRPVIDEAVNRFNDRVASVWRLTYRAEHPDSADGVAVRVCADPSFAAYAYPRTVAIHTGLLRQLQTEAASHDNFLAATAFVLYHELGHVELGHTAQLSNGEGLTYADSLMERQADAFAVAASHQAGFSRDGADLVFSLLDHINPEGSLGHPANRRQALSLY